MKVITKRDDIVENIMIFEAYLESSQDGERKFAADLLKNATQLIAYKVNGENHFVPADFAVYKKNSMKDYTSPEEEEKNIAGVLTKVVGLPFSNEKTEEKFLDYARQYSKSLPDNTRNYWRLKDERRKNLNIRVE